MKYRYLKVSGDLIWGKNEITQQDVIDTKQRSVDVLIDVQEGKQFDPQTNEWKEFKGET